MADTASLRDSMRQLEADVARMRKLIDAQDDAQVEFLLPAEIRVPRPSVVAAYLREHPDVVEIVSGMADGLVTEFEYEPAQIELDQYDDPEIDDHYLTFMVRLPDYPDDVRSFIERLDRVSDGYGDRLTNLSGWLLVTTDFRPIAGS
jgi:hypothetical protein